MRLVFLLSLAACAPDASSPERASDLRPEQFELVGSPSLTVVAPHLVRGEMAEVDVNLFRPLPTSPGATVYVGVSINPGGTPTLCPPALPGCLGLAAPARVWTQGEVVMGTRPFADAVGLVPNTPADVVALQAVLNEPGDFDSSPVVQRGVFDRSEVCEVEIVPVDGAGDYIAYTDLYVDNPYQEGILAWPESGAAFTVFVPSGENLILRDYDQNNITRIINRDAGDAILHEDWVGEVTVPVTCP